MHSSHLRGIHRNEDGGLTFHLSYRRTVKDTDDSGDSGDKPRQSWLWGWRHLWRQSPLLSPASV